MGYDLTPPLLDVQSKNPIISLTNSAGAGHGISRSLLLFFWHSKQTPTMPWTWFLFFHAYLKSPHKIYKQRPKDPWLFAACLGDMGWKKASSPALFDLIVRDLWPQRLGLWQSRAGHERNKKDFTYMLEPEFWIFNKIKTHSFLLETKLIHRSYQRTRPFTYLLALFFVPNCSKKYGCKNVFFVDVLQV